MVQFRLWDHAQVAWDGTSFLVRAYHRSIWAQGESLREREKPFSRTCRKQGDDELVCSNRSIVPHVRFSTADLLSLKANRSPVRVAVGAARWSGRGAVWRASGKRISGAGASGMQHYVDLVGGAIHRHDVHAIWGLPRWPSERKHDDGEVQSSMFVGLHPAKSARRHANTTPPAAVPQEKRHEITGDKYLLANAHTTDTSRQPPMPQPYVGTPASRG